MEQASEKPVYRRILLKLSGEALQGDHLFGLDASKLFRIAEEVADLVKLGVQLAIVIGGGNLIRGADLCAAGFDRISADQIGMLSTVINGLALRDTFHQQAIPCVLMSSFAIPSVAEGYDRFVAQERLDNGRVVIFSGGTGNPLVTTDSAAALRAIEINADIVVKATKVDGVYNDDPIKNPKAERFQQLTYDDVLVNRLKVMDLTAILLCQEQSLPVRVVNMNKNGVLRRVALGEDVGTLIQSGE